jgi:MFS family permease
MTHFRWVVIGLLFAIGVINYIDRTAISFAIHDIAQEYGFDKRAVGLILGAFGGGYFVTTLIGGVLGDRFGSRAVILGSVLVWSVAMLGTGFAVGFFTFYAARVALGLAEGPNFPTMNRAIGTWLPGHERASALSFSLVAVPIALAIGAPIVTTLLTLTGWRGAFIALGIASLLWLPAFYLLFRDSPAESDHVSEAERAYIAAGSDDVIRPAGHQRSLVSRADWRFILTNPTLLANTWAFFVFGYFLFFFMMWLPSYLRDTYKLSLEQVGAFAFVPWAAGAVLMWLFGPLADYLYRRTGRLRVSRSYLIILSQAIAAIAIMPAAFVDSIAWAVVLISIAVGFTMSANAAYFAVTIDVAPKRAATALGVADAGFAIAGFLAPTVTGYIIWATGSYKAAFGLLAALALSSVVAVALYHRPDRSERLTGDAPAGSAGGD